MDNKQKRVLLKSIFKTIYFLLFLTIGWVCYLVIDKIIKNSKLSNFASDILWLDIVLLVFCFFILIFVISDCHLTNKMKNKYGLSKFLFIITFTLIIGIIAGGFYFYYSQISIGSGYLFAICLIVLSEVLCIANFIIGIQLVKLFSKNTIIVDDHAPAPSFDDELLLKKRKDELSRKLEIKKVKEDILRLENELNNNNQNK